jgi:hypothetical protein
VIGENHRFPASGDEVVMTTLQEELEDVLLCRRGTGISRISAAVFNDDECRRARISRQFQAVLEEPRSVSADEVLTHPRPTMWRPLELLSAREPSRLASFRKCSLELDDPVARKVNAAHRY